MHLPSGRCTVCGKPLGSDPHTISTYPDGEHLRCRDWTRQAWPYDELLAQLRNRYRALRRALAIVESFGRWLAESREAWPRGAANTVVGVHQRIEAMRKALDRAGFRTPNNLHSRAGDRGKTS